MRRGNGPPDGKPWVWLTAELLSSKAWGEQSVNCARLTRFLLIEHMQFAGLRNGQLMALYSQLEAFGIPHRLLTKTIDEAVNRGLIAVIRGDRRRPNVFRLTFLPTRETTDTNREVWREPTDDWRLFDVPFEPKF